MLYSDDREFIFGDGFFHNFTAMAQSHAPKMLAPLTPGIAVLYAHPMSYLTNPRLSTLTLSAAETDALNFAVHVYARKALFFRHEQPTMSDPFRQAQHLRFGDSANPVDNMIRSIPGVENRTRIFGWPGDSGP